MDVKTYATIVDLSGRFAGRLSDTVLDAVRTHYYAGEEVIAESALLLGLAFEGVGVTREEYDLVRSILDDPDNPDLDAVAVIDEVPAPAYRFGPTAPPAAPNPTRADEVLAAEARKHSANRLLRTWREPLNGSHGGPLWMYLPVITPDGDELRAYSGISSRLWVTLHEKWQIEPVTEGRVLPPYLSAAVSGSIAVWLA